MVPGYFNAVLTDVGTSGIEGDKIAVFVNEPAYNTFADVTVGNLGFFSMTKDDCKNGGFERFGIFKNQGDCVSYVATGGGNQPANDRERQAKTIERPAQAGLSCVLTGRGS